jgi:nitrogen regulatory protein P-II 1
LTLNWACQGLVKGEAMKKIEAIINASKVEKVKNALTNVGIRRMKISKVDGFGGQKGHKEFYRADAYMVDVIKQFKIELIVTTDEMLRQAVETIEKNAETEINGEEEIFVFPVEEVIRVRTGARGKDAI